MLGQVKQADFGNGLVPWSTGALFVLFHLTLVSLISGQIASHWSMNLSHQLLNTIVRSAGHLEFDPASNEVFAFGDCALAFLPRLLH